MQTRILNNPNITPHDKLKIISPICSVLNVMLDTLITPLTSEEKLGARYITDILYDLTNLASHEIETGKPMKDSVTLLNEMDDEIDTLFKAIPK